VAITTILYDLGGTLVHFDFTPINTKLASSSGKTPEEVKELVLPRYAEFCRGQITGGQWHEFIAQTFHLSMPYDQFRRFWADIFWKNEPMFALAGRLCGPYRSYLLSNTEEIHLPWCLEKFPLGPLLDGMILSYELGAMKPERAIFERGLARFGLSAAECVLIDDLPANLDGARAVGIATVRCESAAQVERDLAALGVRA
jgi:putative hydrolase of the HAD superfamily